MFKHKVALSSDLSMETILEKVRLKYLRHNIITIDGIKIEIDKDSWVHLRKSNTEPIMRIYSEAATYEKAKEIALQLSSLLT